MKKYIIIVVVIVLAVFGYRYYNDVMIQKELTAMEEVLKVVNDAAVEDFSGLEEDLEQYL